jgi:hypothetical protein
MAVATLRKIKNRNDAVANLFAKPKCLFRCIKRMNAACHSTKCCSQIATRSLRQAWVSLCNYTN